MTAAVEKNTSYKQEICLQTRQYIPVAKNPTPNSKVQSFVPHYVLQQVNKQ